MSVRRIRHPDATPNTGVALRSMTLEEGLGDVQTLSEELAGYTDVLLGRKDPPVDQGLLTLMEVADAYYARAKEIEMRILAEERNGGAFKGSPMYRFRTGELRSFIELSRRAADLGSRRLTDAQLSYKLQHDSADLSFGE